MSDHIQFIAECINSEIEGRSGKLRSALRYIMRLDAATAKSNLKEVAKLSNYHKRRCSEFRTIAATIHEVAAVEQQAVDEVIDGCAWDDLVASCRSMKSLQRERNKPARERAKAAKYAAEQGIDSIAEAQEELQITSDAQRRDKWIASVIETATDRGWLDSLVDALNRLADEAESEQQEEEETVE